MKKFAILLLTLLCVLCMCVALAACEQVEQHVMGEWIEETPASCTEAGTLGHYHCIHCDKDFDRDGNEIAELTVRALGHEPVTVEGHEPTCTEPGYTDGTKCDRCGELITAHKTADALGHEPVLVAGSKATCTDNGLSDCYECSRCHKFSLTEDGEYIGDVKEDVQTEELATGHSYGSETVVRGATCTEPGEKKRVCEVCEHEDVSSIDKTAHFGTLVSGTPATCTDSGLADCYQCSMCSKYSETQDGDYTIAQLADAQKTIPAKGHDYESQQWQVVQDSTCQQFGQKERQCANGCGISQVETVELKDHRYPDDWQVTKASTCNEQGVESRTCTTCDPDFGTPATETRTIQIDANAHTVTKVDGKPATCTEAGLSDGQICSLCGEQLQAQTSIDPLGHDGKLSYTPAGDSKFEHHTVKCERRNCPGEEQQCTVTVTDVREDCTLEGTSTRNCELCGYTHTETLQPLQHSWDQGKVTKPATCKEYGEMTYTCNFCDATTTGVIDVLLPHQTDGEWKTADGKHFHECTECGTHLDEEEHRQLDQWISDGTNHWHECEVCLAHIDVGTHSELTLDKVDPTCEQNGQTEGSKCSVCDLVIRQQTEIPAKQHNYGPWQQDETRVGEHKAICDNCQNVIWAFCAYDQTTVDATCTTGGYTLEVCSVCHDEIRLETTSALEHQYGDWLQKVVDEGSPEHRHIHYRDCLRCNASEARQWGDCELTSNKTFPATCTTAGYDLFVCEKCGAEHEAVTSDATGHELVYTQRSTSPISFRHKASCTKCDYTVEETDCTVIIENIQATCTEDRMSFYRCAVCGTGRMIPEYGTKLGHNFGAWEFCGSKENPRHKRVCNREGCNEEVIDSCAMESTTTLPTCEAAGVVTNACKYCFNSFTEQGQESVGHSWTNWKAVTDQNQHFKQCNNCGTAVFEMHEYELTEKTEANCEELGKEVQTCKYCQDTTERVSGELTKHEWKLESRSATSHKAQCVNCNKESEANHDWSDSNLCSVCGYDGLEYTKNGIHCIVKSDNRVANAKHIVIPEKHLELLDNGQYDNNEYTVTEIGESAFLNNKSIETLKFPSTVHTIRNMAFYYCRNLREVEVTGDDHKLTSIGDYAFRSCGALTTFNPPDTLISVGDYAFADSTSLVNIVIGDKLTEIGKCAFMNTGYVNNDQHWQDDMLYLGLHLIKVRQMAMEDGSYTNTTVTVKDGTVSISVGAFSDCKFVTEVVLPASLKIVDKDAFLNCETIQKVEFKGDVRQWFEINFENDFASPLHYGSPSLHIAGAHDQIHVPDGVTRIPAGTFRGTDITEIEIPSSVTYIGEEAFENCAQLAKITIHGEKVNYIGKDAFTGSAYYKDPKNWDEQGVLYVGNYLIDANEDLSGEYTVKDGTIAIANSAFENCKLLTKIVLDKALLFVGEGAFKGCDGMQTIVFTETTYRWICRGMIERVIYVTDTKWSRYSIYYGAWQRYDQKV